MKEEYKLSIDNFNKYIKHPNKKYVKKVIILENEKNIN
jgi:hypothetical protein